MQLCSGAWASGNSGAVRVAIKKYKTGNYTGCLQTCQNIVKYDPSNAIAYYYMAMSYVKAGKKDEAIKSYSRVLSLKPNARLNEYASTGKRCLETPDQCKLAPAKSETPEIDRFIATPPAGGIAASVTQDAEKKRLERIMNKINNGTELDEYEFRKFKDYTKNRSQVEVKDETVSNKKPTNDEIVAALKVLNDAGLNSYAQQAQSMLQNPAALTAGAASVNPYAQAASYQSPDEAQLSMLMGGHNQSNCNNSMMNMLPYMLAQSKNGTSTYSPQLIQSVIMNSMMTDFNFDSNKRDNN